MLPNYDINEANSLAEGIRSDIENYNFTIKEKQVAKITISAGASSSIIKVDYNELIDEADKALRVSKVKGRNELSALSARASN